MAIVPDKFSARYTAASIEAEAARAELAAKPDDAKVQLEAARAQAKLAAIELEIAAELATPREAVIPPSSPAVGAHAQTASAEAAAEKRRQEEKETAQLKKGPSALRKALGVAGAVAKTVAVETAAHLLLKAASRALVAHEAPRKPPRNPLQRARGTSEQAAVTRAQNVLKETLQAKGMLQKQPRQPLARGFRSVASQTTPQIPYALTQRPERPAGLPAAVQPQRALPAPQPVIV